MLAKSVSSGLCVLARRISRHETPCSSSIMFQKRTKWRDGNIDVTTWDGERFVTNHKKHMETPQFPGLYTGEPQPKGKLYDKKPFRFQVEKGKTYLWCSCGLSKQQPFCDKTHLQEEGTSRVKTKPRMRPVKYVATETKIVYFCNCKQTNNKPLCDNSHKAKEIEATANTIFRN